MRNAPNEIEFKITIKEVTKNDFNILQQIENLQDEIRNHGPGNNIPAHALTTLMQQGIVHIHCAFDEKSQPIGFTIALGKGENYNYLHMIGVKKDFQGSQAAFKLLKNEYKKAKKEQKKQIRRKCHPLDPRNMNFYLKKCKAIGINYTNNAYGETKGKNKGSTSPRIEMVINLNDPIIKEAFEKPKKNEKRENETQGLKEKSITQTNTKKESISREEKDTNKIVCAIPYDFIGLEKRDTTGANKRLQTIDQIFSHYNKDYYIEGFKTNAETKENFLILRKKGSQGDLRSQYIKPIIGLERMIQKVRISKKRKLFKGLGYIQTVAASVLIMTLTIQYGISQLTRATEKKEQITEENAKKINAMFIHMPHSPNDFHLTPKEMEKKVTEKVINSAEILSYYVGINPKKSDIKHIQNIVIESIIENQFLLDEIIKTSSSSITTNNFNSTSNFIAEHIISTQKYRKTITQQYPQANIHRLDYLLPQMLSTRNKWENELFEEQSNGKLKINDIEVKQTSSGKRENCTFISRLPGDSGDSFNLYYYNNGKEKTLLSAYVNSEGTETTPCLMFVKNPIKLYLEKGEARKIGKRIFSKIKKKLDPQNKYKLAYPTYFRTILEHVIRHNIRVIQKIENKSLSEMNKKELEEYIKNEIANDPQTVKHFKRGGIDIKKRKINYELEEYTNAMYEAQKAIYGI